MVNRRKFLASSSLAVLPSLFPFASGNAAGLSQSQDTPLPIVKLFGDGEIFEPMNYKKHTALQV